MPPLASRPPTALPWLNRPNPDQDSARAGTSNASVSHPYHSWVAEEPPAAGAGDGCSGGRGGAGSMVGASAGGGRASPRASSEAASRSIIGGSVPMDRSDGQPDLDGEPRAGVPRRCAIESPPVALLPTSCE